MQENARMKHPESQIQQTCVKWFRAAYPKYSSLLFAIPNGGARSDITAKIIKAEGALAGVPDLFLAVPSVMYHGLFIEMKHGNNKPSPEQLVFMHAADNVGYQCKVCYSLDEFMLAIKKYFA